MKDLPCVDLMSPSEFAEWSGLNINTVYRLKKCRKTSGYSDVRTALLY